LAIEAIATGAKRAEELGLPLTVQPLDQLTATVSLSATGATRSDRELPMADGHVRGLGGFKVHWDRLRVEPRAPADDPTRADIQQRRHQVSAHSPLVTPQPENADRPADMAVGESIWTCEFLWDKVYVDHDGTVLPCCVPGVPTLGSLRKQSFEEIWDGPVYRAMRVGLACKDPAPCCRGCQHINEVQDPVAIDRYLAGTELPVQRLPWPDALKPVVKPLGGMDAAATAWVRSARPPLLAWERHPDAAHYEVEMSMDGFHSVPFATTRHGLQVESPAFAVPVWIWDQAPVETAIYWRALAVLPESRLQVGTGALVKTAG
jgi:hypothetical protein